MEKCTITMLPHKKESSRLILHGNSDENWYIASSTNDNFCAEGTWQDWVKLAQAVLAEDRLRQA